MKRLFAKLWWNWRRRKLRLDPSGRYLFGIVIISAFVALSSQNNILYLITSFLLAVLIVSGFVSDYALYSIRFRRISGPAETNRACGDVWEIENRGWLPVFALAVGEWRWRERREHVAVGWLGARSKRRFASKHRPTKRGEEVWDGHYVATSAPFGFVEKTVLHAKAGNRWVAATPLFIADSQIVVDGGRNRDRRNFEGEIREGSWADDARDLVAAALARDPDQPRFRKRSEAEAGVSEALLKVASDTTDIRYERELAYLTYLFRHRGLRRALVQFDGQWGERTLRGSDDIARLPRLDNRSSP